MENPLNIIDLFKQEPSKFGY